MCVCVGVFAWVCVYAPGQGCVHGSVCVCVCVRGFISTNLVLVLATQEDSMHKRKQKSQSQLCARTHAQMCFMVCGGACLSMHVCLHVSGWA